MELLTLLTLGYTVIVTVVFAITVYSYTRIRSLRVYKEEFPYLDSMYATERKNFFVLLGISLFLVSVGVVGVYLSY